MINLAIPDGTDNPCSILGQAERRRAVEPLYLAGYTVPQIAERVGAHPQTIQRDIKFLKEFLSKRYDTEDLRKELTARAHDMMGIAEERYRGGDGKATVEGKLAEAFMNRIAKMQGLDETASEAEVAGAWADYLGKIAGKEEEE